MTKKERLAIVTRFKDGDDVMNLSIDWHLPIETIEGVIRTALKAQDKKKGKA